MFTPAKVSRLKSPAVSSWSRLNRSSASREHDVEPLVQRVSHQPLEAGTEQRRARDRVIGKLLSDRPTLASCELAAHPELVRDRSIALVVR